MERIVVPFPPRGRAGEEPEVGEGRSPDRPRDGRVAWPRMSAEAIARALGERPRRCLERIEFELGFKDRMEGRRPRDGASISYRRGYAFRGPRRRTSRRPRLEVVA